MPVIFSVTVALLLATTVSAVAILSATKADTFVGVHDGDGRADPGETIQYDVVVNNSGADPATGVVYDDTIDPNTTLIPGSLNVSPLAGNDTYATIGNTLLEVGVAPSGNPAVSVTNSAIDSLFDNDSEFLLDTFTLLSVESDTTAPFTTATEQGGSVTVEADGNFSYTPPVGFSGTDNFDYVITDDGAAGSAALSGAGRVTINVAAQRVWYVKNDAAAGGVGHSGDPFDTLVEAQAASAANDTIYIFAGSGTTTGQNAGIALKDSQRLLGEGVALTMPIGLVQQGVGGPNPTPLRAAGSQPRVGNAGGDGISANNDLPAEIRGLSISGSTNAIDITIGDGSTGTLSIGNNTIFGAGAEGIDINHSGSAALTLDIQNNAWNTGGTHTGNAFDVRTTGTGNLALNFGNNTNILSTGADGINVADTGGSGVFTVTGFANNTVHQNTAGNGISANTVTFDATPGGTFQTVSGGTTTVGVAGDGVGTSGMLVLSVSGDLSFTDLDIVASNGTGLSASSPTPYTGSAGFRLATGSGVATVSTTNGPAVALVTVTASLPFADIDSTNSATSGASLNAVLGSFSAGTGSSISNATNADFVISNSNATITYSGSITDSAGAGVDLTANTGSTITFNGGLSLSSGTSIAFNATGGGTVNVCDDNPCNPAATGPLVNTLTSTTGTALNVANTNIGANNVEFRSISSNGAASGIVLNNTGTTAGVHGGLIVRGTDGADAGTLPDTGTGGTIQSTTGDSISLNSTRAVSLGGITISNSGANNSANDNSNWIDATSVVGLTLQNITGNDSVGHGLNGNGVTNLTVTGGSFLGGGIDNVVVFNPMAPVGDAQYHGFFITNLLGTSSITGATFERSNTVQCRINNNTATNFAGTPDTLTVSGNTWQNQAVSPFHGDHLSVSADTGANFRLIVNNTSGTNVCKTGGICVQATGNGSGKMDAQISSIQSGGNTGGTFNADSNTAGVAVAGTASSTVTFNVQNNQTLGTGSVGMTFNDFTSGSFSGTVQNNTITHVAGPGTDALQIVSHGDQPGSDGTATIAILNNTITGNFQRGIRSQAAFGDGTLNINISGNTVHGTDLTGCPGSCTALRAIEVEVGGSGGGTTNQIFLNLENNNAWMDNGNAGYRLFHRAGYTFSLEDLTGSGTDAANITNWIDSVKSNNSNSGAATTLISGVANTFTSHPNTPAPLLAAPGGVEAAINNAVVRPIAASNSSTSLNTQQLDVIVAAAIERWSAAGLTQEQLALLHSIQFQITDLPGAYLSEAQGNRILVDRDAGGKGWFIDANSPDEITFGHLVSATRRYTYPTDAPAGRVDLLTALLHEMGHCLGLEDSYAEQDRDNLMYGYLTLGERRLPMKDQARNAQPDHQEIHFLALPPVVLAPAVSQTNANSHSVDMPPAAPAAPMASGENVNVAIGTLPAGKSVTIVFQVTVDALDPGEIRTQISNQGTVTSNELGPVLTDDPGAAGPSDPTITLVDRPDTTVTSLTRQSANPNRNAGVTWQVVFANPVAGLAPSNFTLLQGGSVSGATITGVTETSGPPSTTWNITASTGSGDGTLELRMANDTSLSHDVTNLPYTQPASGAVYTIDKTAPTVTNVTASTAGCLGITSEFCNAPDVVSVQVVFSEAVNVTGMPQLTLETGATDRTADYTSGSGTTALTFSYTIQAGDASTDLDYIGTTALALNGGSIEDAATNSAILALAAPGTAGSLGANESIEVDTLAPTASYFQRRNPLTSPTNSDTLQFEVDFSEPIGGTGLIGTDDFVVTGTTATATNISVVNFTNGTYAVDVTGGDLASYNGTVGLSFSAGMFITDRAGNPVANVEPATDETYVVDNAVPTVALSSAAPNPTNTSPIPVTVTFSESMSGFAAADITTGNGTVSNFAGSGTTYSFDLVPSGQGLVTADIAAGVAQDASGNGNSAAIQFSRTYDSLAPTVAMSSAATNPTGTSPIPVTVQFSEVVTGFSAGDMSPVVNGAVSNFVAVDGDTYTFDLTPAGDGIVTADIGAGVAQDAAGNPNAAATQFSRLYDTVAPSVTIDQAVGQADPTNASPINFTATFSEDVTDFDDAADLTLSGSAGATTATITGGPRIYTIAVSGMTGAGTVVVTIPAGAALDLAGQANSASTNTDNTVTYIPPTDLSITKTDGVTTAVPGGSVAYTITASNAGPNPDPAAIVADTFPASLTATWTCVGAGGGTCTAAGAGNINDTVNLPVGGSVTYTVSASASASATGTLANTATVSSSISDINPANNSATDTDTLTPQADLAITKTDGVTTAVPGGSVTYTITASNPGPSNAPGTTVADTFPASLTATWTCVGAGGGTCSAAGSGNINDAVNLPAGGSVTYTVSASLSAAATGSLSNTATVAAPAGVTDPNPGNNSATDTDTLTPQADLVITKTDGVTTAVPGGSVTYTITASNPGPSNAPGASVADTFPASLTATWTCVGAGGGTCSAAGSGNINDTVTLPAGGSVTYTANATVSASAVGTLSNTATVAAPAGVTDPNPGNNSATDTDTLVPPVEVTINQASSQADPTNASPVNFTVVFASPVTDFDDASDVTLGGTAGATSVTITGGPATYNLAVGGMTGDGSVTATIAAGVAAGSQGEPNAASTSTDNTVIYDATVPDTTIGAPTPADPSSSASASFSFSGNDGAGSGVARFECQLNGSGFSTCTSPQTYTGLSDTSHTFEVRAIDAAGNIDATPATFTWLIDTTTPTVALSSAAPDPTNVSPIPVTVTFSENVTGFSAADITAANATVNNFAGSGSVYSFDLVPAGQGLVTADIAGGVAQDAAGNGNTAAAQFSRTYDTLAPTVTINQAAGQGDPTGTAPVNFTVVFNEPVSGFGDSAADVTISGTAGATTATVTGSGTIYNVAITGMTGTGTVVVTIPAGAAQDLATNPSAASTSTDNTIDFDPVVPVVTGIVRADPSPTSAASVQFTVTFSKNVTGVDASDFTFTTSGVTGASVTSVSGSGTTWTVTVNTGTGDGTLRLDLVDNDSITDAAANPLGGSGPGNGNFSASQFYTIDKTAPSVVSIVRAGTDPTNAATVDFTVILSEAVSGVDTTDFTLATSGVTGASVTGVTGSGSTWTVTVNTGSGDGSIGLNVVDDDTIVDVIGNQLGGAGLGNGDFTGEAYTIDKTAPIAGSLVTPPAQRGSTTYSFTVVFSDNLAIDIASLDGSDIRMTGPNGFTQLATLVSVSPATNGSPRTATYQVTPPGGAWDIPDGGTYTFILEANQVLDTAGNAASGTTLGRFQVSLNYTTYLPLVAREGTPDLVASISISPSKSAFVAGEPVTISVTVTNQGNGTAAPFWVDLYINPSSPPTAANQVWNTRCALTPCFGMAWAATAGLAPGQSITFTSQSPLTNYSVWPGWFAAGTTDLYAYVDSFNPGVAAGAVLESNELNNRAELHGLSVIGMNPLMIQSQSAANMPARPILRAR